MEAVAESEARKALFQRLKPCCVEISRLTIRDEDGPFPARELQALTTTLLDILHASSADLHDKLAEYVFFPLSHIFRQMAKYPATVIENCITCLRILITYGWRTRISAALVQQIFTLLIFIIDGAPGSQGNMEKPEELILEAFRTLSALLDAAAGSAQAATGLAAPAVIPQLGQGVTAMLDGIVDGVTPAIQEEALRSLVLLYRAIRDHATLATFLPGTLSNLARVLHTPARYKASVLAGCLDGVRVVLTTVLGDLRTRSILAKKEKDGGEKEEDKNKVLGPAWLNATVGQVKKALATMMKLRIHESDGVKIALNRLCITLLDECYETLSNCSTLLVETAVILDTGDRDSFTETNLSHIAGVYPELLDVVKTTVYNWMSSLPRHMQSADEDVKQVAIHNFGKGIGLLRSLNIESSTLESALSQTMCETITSLLQANKTSISDNAAPIQLLESKSMVKASGRMSHSPVLLSHESQRGLKTELASLLRAVSSTSQSGALLADMVEFARNNSDNSQVAAYWLSLEIIKTAHASSSDEDALLNFTDVPNGSQDIESEFGELYSFSVEILDSHSDASAVDWRMEALALEVVAYAAQRSGESFRPELIDVLFPTATFLGSPDPRLQKHAVVTLNILAAASKYASVSELIVDNVDYMVSAVALRLNTLDISPASTQVLTMMIRLAGPHLIPFLDDVVDSIFAALDNYHGYPAFVESLFHVLKEIVDQGAKTESARLLKDHEKKEIHHKKQHGQPEDLNSLMAFLDKREERRKRDEEEARNMRPLEGHPQIPWGEPDKQVGDEETEQDGDGGGEPPSEEKPPSSPTYRLLSRVAGLTQHYLTSPTPRLRRSLLALLRSAAPALAGDEDAFLPLVHALWPVVIGRLADPEPYVVIEACHALAGMCVTAGDFLASRFQAEWSCEGGGGLRDFCRKAKRSAAAGGNRGLLAGRSSSTDDLVVQLRRPETTSGVVRRVEETSGTAGGLGEHASPARIWAAVVALLTAVVAHVRIEDAMFDDVLELLADVLEKRPDARKALEVINADAVWLALYERGAVVAPRRAAKTTVEGLSFVELRA
ncbi:HEAT repeat protein [Cordyceps fumosorosea ARSEF 2679]|uniref:HEAT repeat protein n=1 Tax=Cordyceps fumosorosea (strain ARSEF 2679) TaxID=1081104 RepID=A0A167RN45_CORFA|nr:HEAT repeat protein [Cordyceps fumosorosea ARSEF 2679]OAA58759.1 HEAT repeat protein [Cordyceps fumosorosea ARSEF 2679]